MFIFDDYILFYRQNCEVVLAKRHCYITQKDEAYSQTGWPIEEPFLYMKNACMKNHLMV